MKAHGKHTVSLNIVTDDNLHAVQNAIIPFVVNDKRIKSNLKLGRGVKISIELQAPSAEALAQITKAVSKAAQTAA